MFVMDAPPDVPPQYVAVVVAQTSQMQQGDTKTDRTIGVCQLIENPPIPPETAVNSFTPLGSASVYLEKQEHRKLDWSSWKVTVLQGPEHGTLEMGTRGGRYHPTSDYLGPDRDTFLVQIGDLKVKVLYFFNVKPGFPGGTDGYDPYEDKKYCPKGPAWKISLNPDDPNAPIYTFEHPSQITSALAGIVQANLTFSDLPGEALGQTFGNTITLDTNAAGHGWFLDTTPWGNTEFGRLG